MQHESKPFIYMEKQLGWAHKLGGEDSLGISRVGQTVLVTSQVDGVSDMAPAVGSVGGEGLAKGQWPLPILMPDTSLPPSMPLVPFKLLPRCWSSEGVSLNR